MAIVVDRNSIYSKLSGRVGDLVFKQYKDKTVVTKVPDMENVKPSMLQKLLRGQFAKLSPYYRHFIRQEGNREMLAKEMRAAGKRNLFQFYISKYYQRAEYVPGKGWVVEDVTLPAGVHEAEGLEQSQDKSVESTLDETEELAQLQGKLVDSSSHKPGRLARSQEDSSSERWFDFASDAESIVSNSSFG